MATKFLLFIFSVGLLVALGQAESELRFGELNLLIIIELRYHSINLSKHYFKR